jgi:hypothetical protein
VPPIRRGALFGKPADPLLAFVHIPKTAGGTVTTMLTRAYGEDGVGNAGNYLRDPETTPTMIARLRWSWVRSGTPVVIGHVPYGLFRKNLPRDTRYMTLLREPVDRVLSHYHRHIQRKTADADSLEKALDMRLPDINDLATRFLCGVPLPLGELPASALDDAKANLREFAFVGIQERFDESVVLLQRTLGLDVVPYVNAHVGIDRPAVEAVSTEQRARIAECNQLDAELHAFARELFEDAMAGCDDDLGADVETLRALSADANALAIREAREAEERALQNACDWLDRELPVGAVRPKGALFTAAEAAGVPKGNLKHAIQVMSVERVKGGGGEKLVTRRAQVD